MGEKLTMQEVPCFEWQSGNFSVGLKIKLEEAAIKNKLENIKVKKVTRKECCSKVCNKCWSLRTSPIFKIVLDSYLWSYFFIFNLRELQFRILCYVLIDPSPKIIYFLCDFRIAGPTSFIKTCFRIPYRCLKCWVITKS